MSTQAADAAAQATPRRREKALERAASLTAFRGVFGLGASALLLRVLVPVAVAALPWALLGGDWPPWEPREWLPLCSNDCACDSTSDKALYTLKATLFRVPFHGIYASMLYGSLMSSSMSSAPYALAYMASMVSLDFVVTFFLLDVATSVRWTLLAVLSLVILASLAFRHSRRRGIMKIVPLVVFYVIAAIFNGSVVIGLEWLLRGASDTLSGVLFAFFPLYLTVAEFLGIWWIETYVIVDEDLDAFPELGHSVSDLHAAAAGYGEMEAAAAGKRGGAEEEEEEEVDDDDAEDDDDDDVDEDAVSVADDEDGDNGNDDGVDLESPPPAQRPVPALEMSRVRAATTSSASGGAAPRSPGQIPTLSPRKRADTVRSVSGGLSGSESDLQSRGSRHSLLNRSASRTVVFRVETPHRARKSSRRHRRRRRKKKPRKQAGSTPAAAAAEHRTPHKLFILWHSADVAFFSHVISTAVESIRVATLLSIPIGVPFLVSIALSIVIEWLARNNVLMAVAHFAAYKTLGIGAVASAGNEYYDHDERRPAAVAEEAAGEAAAGPSGGAPSPPDSTAGDAAASPPPLSAAERAQSASHVHAVFGSARHPGHFSVHYPPVSSVRQIYNGTKYVSTYVPLLALGLIRLFDWWPFADKAAADCTGAPHPVLLPGFTKFMLVAGAALLADAGSLVLNRVLRVASLMNPAVHWRRALALLLGNMYVALSGISASIVLFLAQEDDGA